MQELFSSHTKTRRSGLGLETRMSCRPEQRNVQRIAYKVGRPRAGDNLLGSVDARTYGHILSGGFPAGEAATGDGSLADAFDARQVCQLATSSALVDVEGSGDLSCGQAGVVRDVLQDHRATALFFREGHV